MSKQTDNRNPHPTKKGPGRFHKQGMAHPSAPVAQHGAPRGFVLHVNKKRNTQRAMVAEIGARQFKRAAKHIRREQRAEG